MSADEQVRCILDRNGIIAKKEEVERQRQVHLKRMEILAQESELLANNLKKLEVEDKHWDAELAHLENVNVPILCFPNEITSLIFEMARGQSKFDDDDPYRGTWGRSAWRARDRPEVLVSHVCRDWRQVAIACPTIWSHIIIQNWPAGQSFGSAQRLRAYLTRSRDTLLDIVVSINTRSYQAIDCTGALREVLLAVVPHSVRWQRLLIWVHDSWNISPFSLLTEVSAPRLEVFEIGRWPTWRDYRRARDIEGMPDFVTLFQLGAPKLTSVVTCSQLLLPAQSRNISTIYIQKGMKHRPWPEFCALMKLPKLRNLTLDGPVFQAPISPRPFTRMVVNNLRRLRLGCPVASRHIWDIISAPKLTLLMLFEMSALSIVIMDGASPQEDFFPSLKTIAFWKVNTTQLDDLLRIAIATPHVTSLTICDCEASSVFMLSLYEYSFMKHTHLWPQLQKLTYIVTEPELCFANRNPKTYKEAREILLQLVDWRLETFSCRCTLWIGMTHRYEERRDLEIFYSDSLYDVPMYDDSDEEAAHWARLYLPYKHGRLVPWPEKGVIGAGYYGKLKFTDDCLMFPNNLDY